MLTLSEAQKSDRLEEFIAEQEAAGRSNRDSRIQDVSLSPHQSAAIRRSNIAFFICRKFERKENSPR